jgi:hypothetical protein
MGDTDLEYLEAVRANDPGSQLLDAMLSLHGYDPATLEPSNTPPSAPLGGLDPDVVSKRLGLPAAPRGTVTTGTGGPPAEPTDTEEPQEASLLGRLFGIGEAPELPDTPEGQVTEAGTAAPSTTPPPGEAASTSPGVFSRLGGFARDLGIQTLGAAGDIAVGLTKSAEDFSTFLKSKGVPAPLLNAVVPGLGNIKPGVGRNMESLLGQVIEAPPNTPLAIYREVAQFLLPFSVASKAIKVGGAVAKGAAIGAGVDALVVDPDSPMITELLGSLNPDVQDAIQEFIGSGADDLDAEAALRDRFRRRGFRAFEGVVGGAMLDGMIRVVKLLRAGRAAKGAGAKVVSPEQLDALEEASQAQAKQTAEEAAQTAGQQELFDVADVTTAAREGVEGVAKEGTEEAAEAIAKEGVEDVAQPISPTQELEEIARAEAVAVELTKRPLVEAKGTRLDINFEKIKSGKDIKDLLANASDLLPPIQQARKLGTPRAEVGRLAREMGMDVDEFLRFGDGTLPLSRNVEASRQALVASGRELKGLAKKVKEVAERGVEDPTLRQRFLKQFAVHADIQRAAAGLRAEVGRALGMFKEDVTGEIGFLRDIEKQLKGQKGATGTTTEKLARMVDELESNADMARLSRKATDPTAGKALFELWMNNILSSPVTQIVNTTGNAMTAVWSIPERFMTGAFAKVMGGDIKMSESVHMLHGLVEGMGDAFQAAAQNFRTGEATFGKAAKMGTGDVPQFGAKAFGQDTASFLGKGLNLFGTMIRTPTRVLGATDEFFKGINYRMELRALASRAASGAEDPAAEMVRLLRDPPIEMVDQAKKFGEINTFTDSLHDPDRAFKALRKAGGFLSVLRAEHPAIKYIAPIIKTPTNIATFSLERLPIAPLSRKVRADLAAGGDRAALASAKIATSSMVGAYLVHLAATGKITGVGPTNPAQRKAMLLNDWQPSSIRIGDNWVGYDRTDPLGLIFSSWASIGDIATIKPEDYSEYVSGMTLGFMEALSNKTYVQAVTKTIDGIRGGRFGEKGPGEAGKDLTIDIALGFIPAASAVRQLRKTLDPAKRVMSDYEDKYLNIIPGQSPSLPAQHNLFGEVNYYTHGYGPDTINPALRFLMPFNLTKIEQSPISQEIVRLKMGVNMPSKTMTLPGGETMELSDELHQKFIVLAGTSPSPDMPPLKEILNDLIQTPDYKLLDDGPDGAKAAVIKNIISSYRKAAKARMLQDGDVVPKELRGLQ